MKYFWVKCIPWDKNVICCALESGADGVFISDGYEEKVKELGIIKTISKNGDIKLGKDAMEFEIKSKSDEEEAVKLSKNKRGSILILRASNWKIIPLENLIAQISPPSGLVLEVKTADEARTAIGILEKGVDGVLLDTSDLNEIKRTAEIIKNAEFHIELQIARIKTLKPLGLGDRVCIDTCSNMELGEGMLVGNSSSALFLVHSETVPTPYVETRPFRVNAGPVHSYILLPNQKTKYLSELKSGDEVLVVNKDGRARVSFIGRIKVERRPLILIEAEQDAENFSIILQNAETIRLTEVGGNPISIVNLKPKSEIIVYREKAARHFGFKIEEKITEK
ncbi:MAG: 3-dehydroquinate synthase II [Elusimicrobiota bacterium]|nr:3-dehydroquinate synthase II [Elusimicrobiota bacterium]